jgi:hypothetical protein
LDELLDRLAKAGGMPHGAVLADQAAFILGYHQQWADLRQHRPSRVGEDRNSRMNNDKPPRQHRQHRPSGVGEGRNVPTSDC